MTKSNSKATLEATFADISKLIDDMEHQELTLEQSLAHFEKGITLIKQAQKMLNEAEQKVQILMQQNGQTTLAPYGDSPKNSTEDNS